MRRFLLKSITLIIACSMLLGMTSCKLRKTSTDGVLRSGDRIPSDSVWYDMKETVVDIGEDKSKIESLSMYNLGFAGDNLMLRIHGDKKGYLIDSFAA